MIEHVTVTKVGEYYNLVPDKGYLLWNGGQTYTDAVVKDIAGWKAVLAE